MSNLILTSYDNLPPVLAIPFFTSIKKYVPNSHLVFFTRETSNLEFLLTHLGIQGEIIYSDLILHGKCIPALSRFLDYYNYLCNNKHTKVILCDCSDLAFLKDPFPLINQDIIVAEESIFSYKDCSTNVSWSSCLPTPIQEVFFNHPVICAGFIAGTNLSTLLTELIKIIESLGMVQPHIDQPALNFLIRSKFSSSTKVLPVKNPLVEHLNIFPDISVPFPAVAHMYNFRLNHSNMLVWDHIFS